MASYLPNMYDWFFWLEKLGRKCRFGVKRGDWGSNRMLWKSIFLVRLGIFWICCNYHQIVHPALVLASLCCRLTVWVRPLRHCHCQCRPNSQVPSPKCQKKQVRQVPKETTAPSAREEKGMAAVASSGASGGQSPAAYDSVVFDLLRVEPDDIAVCRFSPFIFHLFLYHSLLAFYLACIWVLIAFAFPLNAHYNWNPILNDIRNFKRPFKKGKVFVM